MEIYSPFLTWAEPHHRRRGVTVRRVAGTQLPVAVKAPAVDGAAS